jgi:cytochrome oxidase Cu insertion factor (SCO1/SenC/PrrC family)
MQAEGDAGQAPSIDHSALLYLTAPDGRLVAAFRGDETPGSMEAEIASHLS